MSVHSFSASSLCNPPAAELLSRFALLGALPTVWGKAQGGGAVFETEYWGSSYKEGVEWITQRVAGAAEGRKVRVASCSWPLSTSYYLPTDRFEYVGSYSYGATVVPDIFLASPRWNCHEQVAGDVVHVVSRADTPLLYVKQVGSNVQWQQGAAVSGAPMQGAEAQ